MQVDQSQNHFKVELIVTECRILVGDWREKRNSDQRVQTFTYHMNKSYLTNVQPSDHR